jgi:copper transport protein
VTRAWRRLVVVLGLLVATLLGSASPAAAHAALLETTPSAEQLLDEAPTEVTLLFSERVGTKLGASKVFDPSGRRVDTGRVSTRQDGREVVVPLASDLPQGTYVVQWRVVSEDAHPITGVFTFSIGVESVVGTTAGTASPPGPRYVLGASRVLGFTGLVVLAGVALFLAFLWPAGTRVRRVRAVLWLSWAALAVGGVAALLAQGPYASGVGLAGLADGDLLREVLETEIGQALAVRLGLLVLAAVALVSIGAWGAHATGRPPSLLALAALSGPLAGTFALAGHANAGDLRSVATAVDAVHLLAVSAWVGGLVALVLLLSRLDLRAVLPRWSRVATGAVVVMVVTGSFASWREVRSLDAVLTTDYGRMLLVKVVLVAMMLVAAWGARDLVRRRYARTVVAASTTLDVEDRAAAREERDRRQLRRSVLVEAGIAAVVIALTSVLVQTTPARTAYAPTYSGTSQAGALQVQVDVEPARAGVANVMHVYLQDATGKAVDVEEVRGRLLQGEQVVPVALPRESLGHYEQPRVLVDVGGEWRLELVVRTSDVDSATTTQTVRFR